MQKLKSIIFVTGLILLLLAAIAGYFSIKNLTALRPADSYEDSGVYTFVPYQVLPVQVKNTGASGRDRRMNPTKTVYMIYYRADDGSGYQWSERALTRELGQKRLEEGGSVARRVLTIPDENSYITVEQEQTAATYTAGLQKRYFTILSLSCSYVVVWLLLAWLQKRKRK